MFILSWSFNVWHLNVSVVHMKQSDLFFWKKVLAKEVKAYCVLCMNMHGSRSKVRHMFAKRRGRETTPPTDKSNQDFLECWILWETSITETQRPPSGCCLSFGEQLELSLRRAAGSLGQIFDLFLWEMLTDLSILKTTSFWNSSRRPPLNFQQVSGEIVSSPISNFLKRLKLVVEANGGHIGEKNKYSEKK